MKLNLTRLFVDLDTGLVAIDSNDFTDQVVVADGDLWNVRVSN